MPSSQGTQRAEPSRYSDLSPKRQALLRKFQNIGYGSVENLYFEDGEPLARPAPKTRRNIRLRGNGRRKPPEPPEDFDLKDEHVEFFGFLEQERDGYITMIEVRDGLPAENPLVAILRPAAAQLPRLPAARGRNVRAGLRQIHGGCPP